MDEWHEKQTEALSKIIDSKWCYADVGAAFGEMTDYLMPLMDQGYLFEASPKNFKYLERKYAAIPSEKLVLNNYAVYSEEGSVDFCLNGDFMGGIPKHVKNKTEDIVQVKAITLDKYFEDKRVDLIKIDVEGAEFEVLKGAVNLMEERSPTFQVEFHFDEDWTEENINFLENTGYTMYDLDFNKIEPMERRYQAILSKGELDNEEDGLKSSELVKMFLASM